MSDARSAMPPWQYATTPELVALRQGSGTITSVELNQAVGLDWQVYQTPAYIYIGDHTPSLDENGFLREPIPARDGAGFKLVASRPEHAQALVPDYFLNVRDDLHQVVGVVKKRYRLLQNEQAPLFLDSIVNAGSGHYVTAAALHGGSQVWWLVQLSEQTVPAGDPRETIETYLLLTNSHDGSTGVVLSVVPLRLASQTTLAWPLPQTPRSSKLTHTNSATTQPMSEAERALELGRSYSSRLAEIADQLLHTHISDQQVRDFLDALLPTPRPARRHGRVRNQRGITMAENSKGQITTIYYQNEGQKHLQQTLWGLVLACQFYADHLAISRNTDDATPAENRFKRLTSGNTLGSHALTHALTLLKHAPTRKPRRA